MVKKFDLIAEKVLKKYKNTSVLAFLKMDDNLETWSLLFSAPDINEDESGKERRREIFSNIAKIVVEVLPETYTEISRIGVFGHSDHLVKEVLKYKSKIYINESTKMNGNMIHEAYIAVSNSK